MLLVGTPATDALRPESPQRDGSGTHENQTGFLIRSLIWFLVFREPLATCVRDGIHMIRIVWMIPGSYEATQFHLVNSLIKRPLVLQVEFLPTDSSPNLIVAAGWIKELNDVQNHRPVSVSISVWQNTSHAFSTGRPQDPVLRLRNLVSTAASPSSETPSGRPGTRRRRRAGRRV